VGQLTWQMYIYIADKFYHFAIYLPKVINFGGHL